MDASTSLGVWQPRYIRENPMARKARIHRNFIQNFLAFSASGKNRQVAPLSLIHI